MTRIRYKKPTYPDFGSDFLIRETKSDLRKKKRKKNSRGSAVLQIRRGTKTDPKLLRQAGKHMSRANECHKLVKDAVDNMLRYAMEAGFELLKTKKLIKHGRWTDWLNSNFDASPETARGYMRIAKNWRPVQKYFEGSIFEPSINKALQIIKDDGTPEVVRKRNDILKGIGQDLIYWSDSAIAFLFAREFLISDLVEAARVEIEPIAHKIGQIEFRAWHSAKASNLNEKRRSTSRESFKARELARIFRNPVKLSDIQKEVILREVRFCDGVAGVRALKKRLKPSAKLTPPSTPAGDPQHTS